MLDSTIILGHAQVYRTIRLPLVTIGFTIGLTLDSAPAHLARGQTLSIHVDNDEMADKENRHKLMTRLVYIADA